MPTTLFQLKELYDTDDYLWIQQTISLLKNKNFNELDLEHLIEELDDLGRERKHQVKSLLKQIIRHLLLLEFWTEEYEDNYRHWQSEIITFREKLNDRMTKNFSNYLEDELENIYKQARKYVNVKSGLDTFPQDCPYTIEQLLDEDWFPKH